MKLHAIKESEHATQLSTLVRLSILYQQRQMNYDLPVPVYKINQIRNFTLQTQHLPIILEAKGFFSMEFDPLKDVGIAR